tara:strand:+ start:1016 stop:2107 length:1092 start_codon:yes stop_codon:yes gene_type:complete
MNKKYKIFASGSTGCLVTPQLPCKNRKKTRKKNKKSKKITKLSLIDDIHEYKINNLIKKRIKNHNKWCVLWDDLCISEEYDKLMKYNIQDCFNNSNKRYFYLLQGEYSGIGLDEYIKKTITKDILLNKNKFIKKFKEIFKLLKNVFLGLSELYKHDICHQDITSKNILIKNNKTYIIDYGLSVELNENIDSDSKIIKRMNFEYKVLSRIYEIYPMEYFYYPVKDKGDILNEMKLVNNMDKIINFNSFNKPINDLFNIDVYSNVYNLLEEKLRNPNYQDIKGILRKLDTYSLACMIIILYMDACEELDVDNNIVFNHMKDPKLKRYMDLLKEMLTFESKDRPSMPNIYKKYLNLIKDSRKSHKK